MNAQITNISCDEQLAKFGARCGQAPLGISGEHAKNHVAKAAASGFQSFSEIGNVRVDRQGDVAVVHVDGVMMPEAEWIDEISTRELTEVFDDLATDDSVATVLMLMNTPGGSTLGHSSLISSAENLSASKKLVAHAMTMCCSAGYWLAMTAHSFTSEPGAAIGSIGVRNHLYDYSKAFAEAGIKVIDISTGPLKSAGLLGAEVTEAVIDDMQGRVDAAFEQFKSAVTGSRRLSAKEQDIAFQGGWFLAEEANALNLIDGLSKQATVVAELSAISKPLAKKGTTMSESTQSPAAASTGELKKQFPNSTAEWRESQTEVEATIAEAAVAYAKFQEAEAEKARTAVAETEAKLAKLEEETAKAAAKAEVSKTEARSTRGVKTVSGAVAGEETVGEIDYRELALQYQAKHPCRWSEACLAIKKRYPEARNFFGAPALS